MALGQAYLDLYLADPIAARRSERIADTKEFLDRLVVRLDDHEQDLWRGGSFDLVPSGEG